MRTSPLFMAVLYFGMGVAFTFIATQAVEETVWNATTIILAVVATFNIAVSIRLFNLHVRIKNSKKK
ncbi:YdiK family protein [Halobacillus yeomjeoni]|uniref:YdiK family protein n=1 Tax=Halobacillus yeomjeoni TaxID=311194 RepID=A0A931MWK8_9BACI|nr:YdiK family protein [Halobacillus yeomjeoni]MBH0231540.1 YdiK family protein [Halobacillus yeomjeoni]MCA0984452.1 YdiK family protein [Halobacillus yeomjeoni]